MEVGRVVINRKMIPRKGDWTREQCMEVEMSPKQREVFLIIDEFWDKYGYSPALRDIAYMRGRMGLGNTKRIVDCLIELGVIKRVEGMGRTIRPTYIQFRNLD